MITAIRSLVRGNIENIPTNMLYPLLRWTSGHVPNVKVCNEVNKYFFYVKPEVLLRWLSVTINKFGKYPKATKTKNDSIDIIKTHLKKIYGWSNNEFKKNFTVVKLLHKDKVFLNSLNKIVGMERKECKKLGLEFKKIDEKKKKIVKGVFDFV